MPSDALAEKNVAAEVRRAGVVPSVACVQFPLIVRGGTLKNGHMVHYILNYSAVPQHMAAPAAGIELLHERKVQRGGLIELAAWDVAIIEEDGPSD